MLALSCFEGGVLTVHLDEGLAGLLELLNQSHIGPQTHLPHPCQAALAYLRVDDHVHPLEDYAF